MNRLDQIQDHGVNTKRYPFASFCFGRGWRGHKTLAAAEKSAARDARAHLGGGGCGEPQHGVARTDTGALIGSTQWMM